ncbi:hypothetical protein OLMES_0182 [Oleiphilus messinensis]|uniref:Uncharacterized protein n=1 Tax=Oleiphilus messinensis TaxID=141451 RepID=A0A1Y0I249_9GAMM|nr:hypothetical protein [Oleiphilus messinensis]ARU54289.1 hypothetical protein OLMES_0182 [Oleiphilus messinensis]
MFLNLEDSPVPLKMVYSLAEDLKKNPDRIRLAHELTLDSSKPRMGLKGSHGLFASNEWWNSIREGKIPITIISGVITQAYVSGQDSIEDNNTVDLRLSDGTTETIGIYSNKKEDISLFKKGCMVQVAYALDELKRQPARNGRINYSKVALELAISENEG